MHRIAALSQQLRRPFDGVCASAATNSAASSNITADDSAACSPDDETTCVAAPVHLSLSAKAQCTYSMQWLCWNPVFVWRLMFLLVAEEQVSLLPAV
jgi:hypothetical protein